MDLIIEKQNKMIKRTAEEKENKRPASGGVRPKRKPS
jgi:hypothetical protein